MLGHIEHVGHRPESRRHRLVAAGVTALVAGRAIVPAAVAATRRARAASTWRPASLVVFRSDASTCSPRLYGWVHAGAVNLAPGSTGPVTAAPADGTDVLDIVGTVGNRPGPAPRRPCPGGRPPSSGRRIRRPAPRPRSQAHRSPAAVNLAVHVGDRLAGSARCTPLAMPLAVCTAAVRRARRPPRPTERWSVRSAPRRPGRSRPPPVQSSASTPRSRSTPPPSPRWRRRPATSPEGSR